MKDNSKILKYFDEMLRKSRQMSQNDVWKLVEVSHND